MLNTLLVEIRRLHKTDTRRAFRSGVPALDTFFHQYAGLNQFCLRIGTTYVAAEGDVVLGHATVSPASMDAEDLPTGRRMPRYPLPVLRLARLAVAESARGLGIGGALLGFCVKLGLRMREEYGCVAIVVDAKNDTAVSQSDDPHVSESGERGTVISALLDHRAAVSICDAMPAKCERTPSESDWRVRRRALHGGRTSS